LLATIPGRKRTKGKPLLKTVRYKRKGRCVRCGWCCEYRVCPEHLSYDEEGKALCGIYGEHPDECKNFPQAPPILNPKCGYYFLDTWEGNKPVKFGRDL
jgi:hypothetical protein